MCGAANQHLLLSKIIGTEVLSSDMPEVQLVRPRWDRVRLAITL